MADKKNESYLSCLYIKVGMTVLTRDTKDLNLFRFASLNPTTMTKEQLFQMAGVSYQIVEDKLIFLTEKGDSCIYFPINKENIDGQIEISAVDFFYTFSYLQDILNAQLNGTQQVVWQNAGMT